MNIILFDISILFKILRLKKKFFFYFYSISYKGNNFSYYLETFLD